MTAPEAVSAHAAVLVRGLSEGRRRGARLALGERRAFMTNLRDVLLPWPIPEHLTGHPLGLAACLALQASPTKDAVATVATDVLTPRQISALQVVEGAAAAGWVRDRWPGLGAGLDHVATGVQAADWEGITGTEFAGAALRLAASVKGRGAFAVPEALGQLPLVRRNGSLGHLLRGKAASRLPFSIERTIKKIDGLSIPVGGSGGEEAPDSGAPQMTELERGMTRRGTTSGIPYPEWDQTREVYLPDFVAVREVRRKAAPGAAKTNGRPRDDLDVWFSQPLERCWQGRLADGSDVDIDGVVDARVDTLCGRSPSDLLYRERLQIDRDVACAILIDVSGSLAKPELLEHEMACADALVDAMMRAGETHAVFAFHSDTRHNVVLELLRDFDEPTSVRPSDARLRPHGYTRLGAALRHVTARLVRQPAARRVLLVLSDGVPCDEGYEGPYAYADVAKAAEEAEKAGIALMVLGVDDFWEDDLLATVLGDRVTRVTDIRDLAPALGQIHARLVST